jgi:class 3 adenylate cyclase
MPITQTAREDDALDLAPAVSPFENAPGLDPAALLEALSRCHDAKEVGLVLGCWLEDAFGPRSCSIVLQHGDKLEPVYERTFTLSLLGSKRTRVPDILAPILSGDRLLGAVELLEPRPGSAQARRWLRLALRGAATELVRIDAEQRLRAANERADELRRYVPGAICQQIDQRTPVAAGEREITVLFLDIRSYTHHASLLRCSEVFRLLNRYVRTATGIIRRHGGTVVEFNGDGMMAVFGAPLSLPAKERAAAAAALEVIEAVTPLLVHVEDACAGRPAVGIGVATGPGYVGDIAADDRLIWTAVGSTTNRASRLEALSRELDTPLVVDAATYSRADDVLRALEAKPGTLIRGFDEPIDTYLMPNGRHVTAP